MVPKRQPFFNEMGKRRTFFIVGDLFIVFFADWEISEPFEGDSIGFFGWLVGGKSFGFVRPRNADSVDCLLMLIYYLLNYQFS